MESKERLSYAEGWRRNLRAWKILWKLSPGMFLSKLLTYIIAAIRPYVTIWVSARIIDELAGRRDPQILWRWVMIQLVLGAALHLAEAVLVRWSKYESSRTTRMVDRVYIEKMLELDYADIDRQYVYDLYSQIRQNENWAGWGGNLVPQQIFERLVTAVTQMLGGVALSVSLFTKQVPQGNALAFLNRPVYIVLMLGVMLCITLVIPVCTQRADRFFDQCAAEARLGNRFFSFFGYMCRERERAADLRIYSQQEQVCSVYMQRGGMFTPKSPIAKYSRGPKGLWTAAASSVSAILSGVVYLFVCLKAWGGAFGVGMVTQYVGAIMNLFTGISKLLQELSTMRINGGFLESYEEFLNIPNQMYQGSLTTEKRSDRQYEVEFRDVSFQYPGSEAWALRHVNMKFCVGSRLAVVGMNGSGKTTFIKLLCRLYDPTQGQILLNGIDIRKYRYPDYIDIFSVVFQDFRLLARPLGENVAGTLSYDRDRVTECLEKAGFGERMKRMPEGLETYLYKELNENGVELSGGEAQKVAIARALYKDAPFIILDEPTAALDPIAEAEIYSRLNDIVDDRTAIYISHRLSSCRFCDEIAVFHEGQIVQQGPHETLVADQSGKYYELWNAQAQYYTKN